MDNAWNCLPIIAVTTIIITLTLCLLILIVVYMMNLRKKENLYKTVNDIIFYERGLAFAICHDKFVADYAAIVVAGLKENHHFSRFKVDLIQNYHEGIAEKIESIEFLEKQDRIKLYHKIVETINQR